MPTIDSLKRPLLLALCALLPACALFQRPPRPVRASPQEAAGVEFPIDVPNDSSLHLTGIQLAAIQLAMEDFLPWDIKPHKGATPREECLYRRDSYDVFVTSHSESLVYVDFAARPGACEMGLGPVLDMGAVYAIDVKNWRILAVQH
ncbi:hypothetical protein [Hyalangium rubrum]|uniref:Lipoprotein n=1 Tax=Hyalangium rubrum TaxID=3103134 RepID=A0ABU5GXY0_9BACT|nr:hypothetical protein [Hyalangium sp. s54d21]MDY7225941.1 hypothetical protein [Hyalangium sp. s54d21]